MNLMEIKEELSKLTFGRGWTNFERFDYRRTVYEYDRLTEDTCDIIAECKNVEIAGFIANAPEWLASLVSEVERLREQEKFVVYELIQAAQSEKAIKKQLEEAQEVLEWYAEEKNWSDGELQRIEYPEVVVTVAEVDGGQRARDTLKRLRGDQQ